MRKGWTVVVVFLILFISSTAAGAEPLSSVKVSIPDYTVTTIDDLDYVEIPEGEILVKEEGRPRVPYYIKSINYPEGYRVQEVILKERSGLETATGLRLPVVILDPLPELPIEMIEGWYPEEVYDWSLWENLDGSTSLVIKMYPFYYDPETTNVEFYKDYRFEIEYVVSSVAITSLTTDKDAYEPGDKVPIDIWLSNPGEACDVIVSIVIKQYGLDEVVDGLPLRSLKNLSGNASLTVDWETDGIELGYYHAEVTLTDTAGNVLDNNRVEVPIQVSEAMERPTGFFKDPIFYLIIGAIVVVAIVALFAVRRRRKKA